MTEINGVYLPLITPFYRERVDFESLGKLIDHYIEAGISGLIPLATTGEIPTVTEEEYYEIIDASIDAAAGRVPLFIGLSGNSTNKMLHQLNKLSAYKIDGLLITAPYYNLPSQEGIYRHFNQLAENTDLDMILYNIPYRTGRNIENETVLKLAEIRNIIGIKDSCGNLRQSLELIRKRPENFSVLTGEDLFYISNLANGGQGAILASAHIFTELFLSIYNEINKGKFNNAVTTWMNISGIIEYLFAEPNPAPLKYLLKKNRLIRSDEVRGPLCRVSGKLAKNLDKIYSQIKSLI